MPLPDGVNSSTGWDVNSEARVVGSFSGGEPALWFLENDDSYTASVLETLETGTNGLPIDGGLAKQINDSGEIVGFSRNFGFMGGPATLFSATGQDPINLAELGFVAEPNGMSESGYIAGGSLRMNLETSDVLNMGVPTPPNDSFIFVIGYAVNDHGDVVAAAHRATASSDRWLTYVYHDDAGWSPVDPAELALPNVGFYDINNRCDVAFSGGIRFAEENVIVRDLNDLIAPEYADWNVETGYINNDRSIATTAFNTTTGQFALVLLTPQIDAILGDVNQDGIVDLLDVAPFVALLATGGFQAEADINQDGAVNLLDIDPFIAILIGG